MILIEIVRNAYLNIIKIMIVVVNYALQNMGPYVESVTNKDASSVQKDPNINFLIVNKDHVLKENTIRNNNASSVKKVAKHASMDFHAIAVVEETLLVDKNAFSALKIALRVQLNFIVLSVPKVIFKNLNAQNVSKDITN